MKGSDGYEEMCSGRLIKKVFFIKLAHLLREHNLMELLLKQYLSEHFYWIKLFILFYGYNEFLCSE